MSALKVLLILLVSKRGNKHASRDFSFWNCFTLLESGYGAVWKAKHEQFSATVAIALPPCGSLETQIAEEHP